LKVIIILSQGALEDDEEGHWPLAETAIARALHNRDDMQQKGLSMMTLRTTYCT
jgi:hypothetical protein